MRLNCSRLTSERPKRIGSNKKRNMTMTLLQIAQTPMMIRPMRVALKLKKIIVIIPPVKIQQSRPIRPSLQTPHYLPVTALCRGINTGATKMANILIINPLFNIGINLTKKKSLQETCTLMCKID